MHPDSTVLSEKSLIDKSRQSCVRIECPNIGRSGTGFWISDRCIITCFHVLGDPNSFQIRNIEVITSSGEKLDAECVSFPSQADPAPIQYDFAVIKVKSAPTNHCQALNFISPNSRIEIGSEILFSGFPLDSPDKVSMVTHKGMISGLAKDGSLVSLEAPINKGNSGGAVISTSGEVLGIVDQREGGISQGLDQVRQQIAAAKNSGAVYVMGVNANETIGSLIETLDKYISTGMGYAVNIKFAQSYLSRHSDILK